MLEKQSLRLWIDTNQEHTSTHSWESWVGKLDLATVPVNTCRGNRKYTIVSIDVDNEQYYVLNTFNNCSQEID